MSFPDLTAGEHDISMSRAGADHDRDMHASSQFSQESGTTPREVLPVVVIGGGDESALEHFFAAAPPDGGACYLVLNPTPPLDQLAARLGRVSSLTLCTAGLQTPLTPDQIVLVPPGHALTVVHTAIPPGALATLELTPAAASTPLDDALCTLDAALGPALFAIILPPHPAADFALEGIVGLAQAVPPVATRLRQDLADLHRQLQLVIDEYAIMNKDLKAANE